MYFISLPTHSSCPSIQPGGHVHLYDPSVLIHPCSHVCLCVAHSSTSLHVTPSAWRTQPRGHEHVQEPRVFTHVNLHGGGTREHSSTSKNQKSFEKLHFLKIQNFFHYLFVIAPWLCIALVLSSNFLLNRKSVQHLLIYLASMKISLPTFRVWSNDIYSLNRKY